MWRLNTAEAKEEMGMLYERPKVYKMILQRSKIAALLVYNGEMLQLNSASYEIFTAQASPLVVLEAIHYVFDIPLCILT